jgi:hypothetical protein
LAVEWEIPWPGTASLNDIATNASAAFHQLLGLDTSPDLEIRDIDPGGRSTSVVPTADRAEAWTASSPYSHVVLWLPGFAGVSVMAQEAVGDAGALVAVSVGERTAASLALAAATCLALSELANEPIADPGRVFSEYGLLDATKARQLLTAHDSATDWRTAVLDLAQRTALGVQWPATLYEPADREPRIRF